jgi:hypothetical protein
MLKGNPPRELSLVETCIGDDVLIESHKGTMERPGNRSNRLIAREYFL